MAEASIFVFGTIGDMGDGSEFTSLPKVKQSLDSQIGYGSIRLYIDSVGGITDEAWAINDFIDSLGVPVHTEAVGRVMSSATILFLSAPLERRIMRENSTVMIHNPWTKTVGDADQIERAARLLREEEDKMAAFYAKNTDMTEATVRDIMKEETYLNRDQSIALGIASSVKPEEEIKAVAKLKLNTMEDKEKEISGADKFFAKLDEKFSALFSRFNSKEEEIPEDHQKQIDELKAELAKKDEELEAKNKELEELTESISGVKEEMETQISAMKKEFDDFKNKVPEGEEREKVQPKASAAKEDDSNLVGWLRSVKPTMFQD